MPEIVKRKRSSDDGMAALFRNIADEVVDAVRDALGEVVAEQIGAIETRVREQIAAIKMPQEFDATPIIEALAALRQAVQAIKIPPPDLRPLMKQIEALATEIAAMRKELAEQPTTPAKGALSLPAKSKEGFVLQVTGRDEDGRVKQVRIERTLH